MLPLSLYLPSLPLIKLLYMGHHLRLCPAGADLSPSKPGWGPTEWKLLTLVIIVLNAFRVLWAVLRLPPGIALRINTRKLNTRKLQCVEEESGMGLVRGWKDARKREKPSESKAHTSRGEGNTRFAGP